jgi:hypothetical protein
MSTSRYISGFLSNASQRAHAENENEGADTTEVKPKTPPTEQVALLRRIRKVVFGPSVKDLASALDRFNAIVDSLDDSEGDDEKKQAPKPADEK